MAPFAWFAPYGAEFEKPRNLSLAIPVLVTKQRIKLNPRHIRGCDIANVPPCTFLNRRFSRGFLIRQRMMPKSKKAPTVRLSKPILVLHAKVNTVVLAVEISPSRWFCARTVWKSWFKNTSQFFDNDGSFGKLTGLQIGIDIFLLNVDVMIFGKARLSVVQSIGG
jgi:hypothetical protein